MTKVGRLKNLGNLKMGDYNISYKTHKNQQDDPEIRDPNKPDITSHNPFEILKSTVWSDKTALPQRQVIREIATWRA